MYIPNSNVRYAETFDTLVSAFGLQDAYNRYILTNPSSLAPYHNMQHMKFVVEDTFMYLPINCPQRDVRTALFAAMFHDFGHTGGSEADNINIAKAIDAIDAYFPAGDTCTTAKELIRTTEYLNGAFTSEPDNDLAKALRDADLSTIFHVWTDKGVKLYEGLLEEAVVAGHVLSRRDFVDLQEKFLLGATFYTPFAKELRDWCLESSIAQLRRKFLG